MSGSAKTLFPAIRTKQLVMVGPAVATNLRSNFEAKTLIALGQVSTLRLTPQVEAR
ncbi:hypothetical protein GA0061101_14918 [Rhizobium lusitanum]|uniref:Uncharacterized protein n=1 Tax=Rhizobium lusitanum TaxID=293958 RepID=A0A1C3XJQ6_9HYPH|nr:hypothetical protein GA0061101_14918 [Rhizobium lusitanum]